MAAQNRPLYGDKQVNIVSYENLEELQQSIGLTISEDIEADIKNSGYDYSCHMIYNMKMLNQCCNRTYTLDKVAYLYTNQDSIQYAMLPDEAKEYINAIGDECKNLQLQAAMEAEAVAPVN